MFLWQQDPNNLTQSLVVSDTSDAITKAAVEASAEKIIAWLPEIILDDSLYLIFEWDVKNATLTASVTDASKRHDSPQTVRSEFSGLNANFSRLDSAQRLQHEVVVTENIKFWLHDYLTTCTAFFQFSLVAIFHADVRDKTELL